MQTDASQAGFSGYICDHSHSYYLLWVFIIMSRLDTSCNYRHIQRVENFLMCVVLFSQSRCSSRSPWSPPLLWVFPSLPRRAALFLVGFLSFFLVSVSLALAWFVLFVCAARAVSLSLFCSAALRLGFCLFFGFGAFSAVVALKLAHWA